MSPDLLVIPPLSDVPPATDYPSLQERAIKFGADLAVHRTRLTELVGAVKQREFSEETIVEAEKARAAEIDALVQKLNNNEARRSKPWYQQLFGKRKD
ncbi:hypothetical protein [Litorimonas haliclonae]|uniref:hypothetical protein n=1 Tax=Litorimonas haliclonae TaxID=2081977 RepID=UPI0039EE65BA